MGNDLRIIVFRNLIFYARKKFDFIVFIDFKIFDLIVLLEPNLLSLILYI